MGCFIYYLIVKGIQLKLFFACGLLCNCNPVRFLLPTHGNLKQFFQGTIANLMDKSLGMEIIGNRQNQKKIHCRLDRQHIAVHICPYLLLLLSNGKDILHLYGCKSCR